MKKLLLLFFLSPSLLAQDCRTSTITAQLRPGAEWSISNEDFTTLRWIDKVQSAPTLSEYQTALSQCLSSKTINDQKVQTDLSTVSVSTNTDTAKLNALIEYLTLKGLLK